MRMAIDPHRIDRFSNTLHPEPVWLMAGKLPGKNYRTGRFMPPERHHAHLTAIEKLTICQSVGPKNRFGMPFA